MKAKKRKRKRKKKKRKKREEPRKVWNCMDLWILYEIMCIWIMVRRSIVCKPRVWIGFHPSLGFLEIRGGKTLNGIKSIKSSL